MRIIPFKKKAIYFILFLLLLSPACTPLIGPFSPTAYHYATSLKAETLALMDNAIEPYLKYEQKVDALMVEINKAYEYVHGVPLNDFSARQWEILKKSDGDLLGKFFQRWKEEGILSDTFIEEFKKIIADAFDEIICLEVSKKDTTKCLNKEGK